MHNNKRSKSAIRSPGIEKLTKSTRSRMINVDFAFQKEIEIMFSLKLKEYLAAMSSKLPAIEYSGMPNRSASIWADESRFRRNFYTSKVFRNGIFDGLGSIYVHW